MQDAFGIVLFVVVGIGVVVAIASLFGRGRLYDDIGRGGLSIGEDRDTRSDAAPTSRAVRDDEIRQMLEARNERRARRGQPPLDIEAELAALVREPAAVADPALVAEVRQLVVARNERRARAGKPPLDVEEEVERQVRELG
jgi:hypothetical protein